MIPEIIKRDPNNLSPICLSLKIRYPYPTEKRRLVLFTEIIYATLVMEIATTWDIIIMARQRPIRKYLGRPFVI